MPSPPEECCLPGDITVTPIPSGYLIGKATEPIGPGPWWLYMAIIKGLPDAIREARALARSANVRAWFSEGGDKYRPIPLDDSHFPKDRPDA